MQYIVLDLEWNNTYAKKAKGYIKGRKSASLHKG